MSKSIRIKKNEKYGMQEHIDVGLGEKHKVYVMTTPSISAWHRGERYINNLYWRRSNEERQHTNTMQPEVRALHTTTWLTEHLTKAISDMTTYVDMEEGKTKVEEAKENTIIKNKARDAMKTIDALTAVVHWRMKHPTAKCIGTTTTYPDNEHVRVYSTNHGANSLRSSRTLRGLIPAMLEATLVVAKPVVLRYRRAGAIFNLRYRMSGIKSDIKYTTQHLRAARKKLKTIHNEGKMTEEWEQTNKELTEWLESAPDSVKKNGSTSDNIFDFVRSHKGIKMRADRAVKDVADRENQLKQRQARLENARTTLQEIDGGEEE